jgi:hypothetical protein
MRQRNRGLRRDLPATLYSWRRAVTYLLFLLLGGLGPLRSGRVSPKTLLISGRSTLMVGRSLLVAEDLVLKLKVFLRAGSLGILSLFQRNLVPVELVKQGLSGLLLGTVEHLRSGIAIQTTKEEKQGTITIQRKYKADAVTPTNTVSGQE